MSLNLTDWLDLRLQRPAPHFPPSPELRVNNVTARSYTGAEDLNSGSRACVTSALLTKPQPAPPGAFLMPSASSLCPSLIASLGTQLSAQRQTLFLGPSGPRSSRTLRAKAKKKKCKAVLDWEKLRKGAHSSVVKSKLAGGGQTDTAWSQRASNRK